MRGFMKRFPLWVSGLVVGLALTGFGGAAVASGLLDGNKLRAHSVGLSKLKPSAVKALKGKTAVGLRGPVGPQGPAGAAGSNGIGGANGLNGVTSVGQPGQTGPAGAGVTPLTFGPYAYTQLDHNQVCPGPQWATDTGNVTYIVTPTVAGLFNVVELREGNFVVNAGNLGPISTYPAEATINSPGASGGCGFLGSRVSQGVTGRFYGEKVYLDFSAAFDFTQTCAAGCASGAFFNTFFGTGTPPPVGSDQFHYKTATNTWNWNAISGPPNSGDITQ